MSVSSHTYNFISHFQISAFYFCFFPPDLNFGCNSKNGLPAKRKTASLQNLCSLFFQRVVSHCIAFVSALASLSGREGGGGGVPWHCQGASGLAGVGRKGDRWHALAFRGGSIAMPARECCRGIDDGKGGRWRLWACRGIFGGATSARRWGGRAAVGGSGSEVAGVPWPLAGQQRCAARTAVLLGCFRGAAAVLQPRSSRGGRITALIFARRLGLAAQSGGPCRAVIGRGYTAGLGH